MTTLFNKGLVRIQNPRVMLAVISGVLLVLTNTGVLTVESYNYVNDILNAVFSLFVGLGVFSDPESHLIPSVPAQPVFIPQAPIVAPPVAPIPAPVVAPTLNTVPVQNAIPPTTL